MIKVKVKYFGIAQDYAQKKEEEIDTGGSLQSLIDDIFKKYPLLNNPNIKITHNFQIITDNTILGKINLKENDEIAFLPPFAGG